MRSIVLLALVVAGCGSSAVPLSQPELAVRMAAAERGSDLSRALVCGADQASVSEFAQNDPPPPGATRELARLYRATLITRVRESESLRGASLNPNTEECVSVRNRPELARLWRTRRTGREDAGARSRAR